ncbi:MAG: EF-P 5-aminopentanol modification-associated protein YfmH [Oscillospiraceae bacterium]
MRKDIYPEIGETVYRETLPNGLQVAVVPKEGYAKSYALFATRYGGMDMRFRIGGEFMDTPAGIAHYLEHKMFDTEEGNALQELAKNGAEPNAFTSNAMTAYYFDSTEHFEENLRILLSFVSVPYFTEESVEKERGIIGQEIRMVEDNPEWQVYEQLMQCLYRSHPVRVPVAGSVESISHITAETLYDCHRMFYTPSNMILVVVGAVEPERICAIAREVLPERGGEAAERDYGGEEPPCAAERERSRAMEVSQPSFLVGFKCCPPEEGEAELRESLVGELACDILLGDSSPLFNRLYTEGLINAGFGGGYDIFSGSAVLYAGGDGKDPRAVRDAVLQEARRVAKEGVDSERFQKILRGNYGETLRGFNSFENIALLLTEGYFRGYDAYRFAELYRGITEEDVRRFIEENLTEERCALSVICPAESA